MSRHLWATFTILFLLSSLLPGCMYFSAKKEMQRAEETISEMRVGGGQKAVPYEYTSAEKFLEVSRMEFDENDYKAARDLAIRSKASGEAGLSGMKKK